MTALADANVGTAPVREAHRFDEQALTSWMESHVEGFEGPLSVEQFNGGQSNPTFRLEAESGRYVLRRKPPGKLLPSAHAVDREYRVMSALAGTGVPVAIRASSLAARRSPLFHSTRTARETSSCRRWRVYSPRGAWVIRRSKSRSGSSDRMVSRTSEAASGARC